MNAKDIKFPGTLIEAVRQFSDLDHATELFASIRWGNEVCCPHCGSIKVDYLPARRLWQCREDHKRNQFSVKIGTIFEECRLPIDKCLIAIWLEVNAKNSISSYEVARHLGVTQKTAWFLLHRIRLALKSGTFEKKLNGIIEADETAIGGLAHNMHKHVRERKIGKNRGVAAGKTVVMGMLARGGEVRAEVLVNMQVQTIREQIKKHVELGSQLMTDQLYAYKTLKDEYAHQFVNHTVEYVNGIVHTNGLENFWALFKRCIKGTHISIEPFHLAAYVDSEAFRFNNRDFKDGERFKLAIQGVSGKRLTYMSLIGASEECLAGRNDNIAGDVDYSN